MLKQLAPIGAVAVALEFLWILLHWLSPLRENTAAFIAVMLTAFSLCIWSFFRLPLRSHKAVLLVLLAGLLFRLTVLPAEPDQSEDIYRYLWDARLNSLGLDAHLLPPDAAELEPYRDEKLYPKLNSRSYRTVYPALAQLIFGFSYQVFGASIIPLKAIFGTLEFLALLLAWKLIAAFRGRLTTIYLLAWNPLFIFEFWHSGHSDSAMIFLLLLCISLLQQSRRIPALVCWAGAVLVKLHPALWLGILARIAGWKAAVVGIGVGLAVAASYYSFDALFENVRALGLYFRLFEFNSGIHYLLRFAGRAIFDQAWNKATGPYLATTVLLITALISWKFPVAKVRDVLHAGFWVMVADLCLATTVHPWYLAWAAFALPFFPYAFMAWWTGAVYLSYIAYARQPVYEPAWALICQYVPMYLLMAWEISTKGPLLERWLRKNESSAG